LTVYKTKQIESLIEEKSILPLTADLTNENPEAEMLLSHLGSRSIPFLAIFLGDDPYRPIIMRDIVRKKSLTKILNSLK